MEHQAGLHSCQYFLLYYMDYKKVECAKMGNVRTSVNSSPPIMVDMDRLFHSPTAQLQPI